MIAEGTADELKTRTGGQLLAVQVPRQQLDAARTALSPLGEVEQVEDGSLVVPVPDRGAFVVRAASLLGEAGVTLEEIGVRRPTLDDVFLQLTGAPPAPDPARGAASEDKEPAE